MELDMALASQPGRAAWWDVALPVIPVVGLAFVGPSSGTFKFFAELSSVVIVVLLMMTLDVAYFG